MNAIFTIISNNYLSYARTLCDSYLEHNPFGKVFVMLVDKNNGSFKIEDERFILIEADQIGIPDFESFSFKYSIMELNTAVKPFFIEYLYKNYPIDKLIYFDPDILIMGSCKPIFDLLNTNNIVLTPHLTKPLPDDGHMPSEVMIMRAGTYNLGFIALGKYELVADFIDWWKDRLYKYCINDVNNGLFVDQKFIDLIVGFRNDIFILRDPQYNIAYWNLHERYISYDRNKFVCNSKPICFYHFSGIQPAVDNSLSKHQTRINLSDNKHLWNLFQMYRAKLMANGYDTTRKFEYNYGKYSSGELITDSDRRKYYHMTHDQKTNVGNPYIRQKQ